MVETERRFVRCANFQKGVALWAPVARRSEDQPADALAPGGRVRGDLEDLHLARDDPRAAHAHDVFGSLPSGGEHEVALGHLLLDLRVVPFDPRGFRQREDVREVGVGRGADGEEVRGGGNLLRG